MNVQVGDKVRFLNDVGGGIVTRLIDKKSVMVNNHDGFEVPSLMSELVVIEEAPVYIEKTNRTNAQPEPSAAQQTEIIVDTETIFYPEVNLVNENGNDIKLYFAFVPQGRPGNSDLSVYLINDSNYNVLYSIINTENEGMTSGNCVGILEANTKEQTETIAFSNINELPEYHFHLLFYRKGEFQIKEPVSKSIKINPVRFFKEKAYLKNDFFDEDSLLFTLVNDNLLEEEVLQLSEKDLNNILKQKEQPEIKLPLKSPKLQEKEILEIDLHIQELLDDFRGLSNGEILEIQMKHFKAKLDEAMQKGPKRLVFIHGVGNGTLKLELRKELDKKTNKLTYQDASFKEYGYGATMVQLK